MPGVHDPSAEQHYVGSQFYQPEMPADYPGVDHLEEEPPLLEGRTAHTRRHQTLLWFFVKSGSSTRDSNKQTIGPAERLRSQGSRSNLMFKRALVDVLCRTGHQSRPHLAEGPDGAEPL